MLSRRALLLAVLAFMGTVGGYILANAGRFGLIRPLREP